MSQTPSCPRTSVTQSIACITGDTNFKYLISTCVSSNTSIVGRLVILHHISKRLYKIGTVYPLGQRLGKCLLQTYWFSRLRYLRYLKKKSGNRGFYVLSQPPPPPHPRKEKEPNFRIYCWFLVFRTWALADSVTLRWGAKQYKIYAAALTYFNRKGRVGVPFSPLDPPLV